MSTNIQNSFEKEKEKTIKRYSFKSRQRNPNFDINKLPKKVLPLRSCLILNKSSKKYDEILIKDTPKWLTTMQVSGVSEDTGEIFYFDDYKTDDLKQGNSRMIKTVEKFCNYYEPLYKKRKVSVLFHTFTRIEHSKKDMITMLECVKMRYKSLNRPIRGYLWCCEVSETLHIHYHLVVAIDRLTVSAIPDELKMESLWGQRTGVEFIKRSVKRYLTKYLYKGNARIIMADKSGNIKSKRMYAISRKMI